MNPPIHIILCECYKKFDVQNGKLKHKSYVHRCSLRKSTHSTATLLTNGMQAFCRNYIRRFVDFRTDCSSIHADVSSNMKHIFIHLSCIRCDFIVEELISDNFGTRFSIMPKLTSAVPNLKKFLSTN